jgi:hypothetical protein
VSRRKAIVEARPIAREIPTEGENVMSRIERIAVFPAMAAFLMAVAAIAQADDGARIAALEQRMASLEKRLTLQEDIEKVRIVAFTYGYFADNVLYDDIRALFSPNIESCEVSGYGVFKGLQGCNKLWGQVVGKPLGGDKNRLVFGRLAKHYLIKDVITIAPDGRTAQGRFDYMSVGGTFGNPDGGRHQIGVYQFGFVKEDGIWKISKFHLTFDTINFNHKDWTTKPAIRCPNPDYPPDEPTTFYHPFPENGVVAFHYPHPVTGKPIQGYVTDTRYWFGNWPGEFGKGCGRREDILGKAADAGEKAAQ